LTGARAERRLAAILAADVAGFSALMERDEEGTYSRIGSLRREVIEPRLSGHQGRLVKSTGDGFLAEFASPIAALRCALAIQRDLTEANSLRLRIGLNLGDVIIEAGGDVYGEGVNVAARLEALAEPGGILISGKIYGEVEGKVDAYFEDMGEKQVKNITRPVRIYAVRLDPVNASAPVISAPKPLSPLLQLPDKPSIAVLPFDNMSSDPEQGYFADGITEDIITTLSYISSLFVIARNSCFAYKGKARDLRQVGQELGVRYVLEGSVRRSADRIRITAQLIDANSGSHLWADRYDRLLADVFDIQDELTKEIVTALRVVLTEGEEARVWQRSTDSISAWGDAVRGFDHIWRGTAADMTAARQYLSAAIGYDPRYAKAITMLALTHYFDVRFSYTTAIEEAKRQFAELTDRALALNPNEPYAVGMKANVLVFEGHFDEAVQEVKRALAISPSDAFLLLLAARVFINGEQPAEGEQAIRSAMRLNPFYPVNYLAVLGDALVHQGKTSEALDAFHELVRRNPNYISAHLHLAGLYSEAGKIEKARQEIAEVLRINPSYLVPMASSFYLSSNESRKQAFLEALRSAGLPE
jgi:adenylate cyclase